MTTTCKHCGRPRKDHGKTEGRCPNPAGKTWTTFGEAIEAVGFNEAARLLGQSLKKRPTGDEYDGTEDYNERVERDDANHRKHIARVLREEGAKP